MWRGAYPRKYQYGQQGGQAFGGVNSNNYQQATNNYRVVHNYVVKLQRVIYPSSRRCKFYEAGREFYEFSEFRV